MAPSEHLSSRHKSRRRGYPRAQYDRRLERALCRGHDQVAVCPLESIEGKMINERPLLTTRIAQVADTERCHILFISTSEGERLRAILDYLHERPILTIADMPNFAQAGGIIKLKTVEDRIQFEINIDAANAANLKLNSKLLRLGNIVSADAM